MNSTNDTTTKSEKGSDKRNQARILVDDEICVRDISSGLELGTIANIHEEGFMVISDGGLKEDHLYQIAFESSERSVSGEDIQLGAECLWLSETGTGDQIWAGFQIMEISDSAQSNLDKLVAQYED